MDTQMFGISFISGASPPASLSALQVLLGPTSVDPQNTNWTTQPASFDLYLMTATDSTNPTHYVPTTTSLASTTITFQPTSSTEALYEFNASRLGAIASYSLVANTNYYLVFAHASTDSMMMFHGAVNGVPATGQAVYGNGLQWLNGYVYSVGATDPTLPGYWNDDASNSGAHYLMVNFG